MRQRICDLLLFIDDGIIKYGCKIIDIKYRLKIVSSAINTKCEK